ncbi:hypothetical protein [Xanthobacter oligotrophicus]|uniref:hypothetical protein n=1 Tax=Xanthobacter oligotrophicus TaxID=2607286 RepID=UPI00165D3EE8|nr:hypothetical protein [Xanthobacter oligotrophicus]MCG5235902.1 hypothetical protein [Xanthobacter oligotrophicus]
MILRTSFATLALRAAPPAPRGWTGHDGHDHDRHAPLFISIGAARRPARKRGTA